MGLRFIRKNKKRLFEVYNPGERLNNGVVKLPFEECDYYITPTGKKKPVAIVLNAVDEALTQVNSMVDPIFAETFANTEFVYTFSLPTMAVDGIRLYINPEFVIFLLKKFSDEDGTSPIGVAYVLLHEFFHNFFGHTTPNPEYKKNYPNRELANIAQDYEINGFLETSTFELDDDGEIDLPFEGFTEIAGGVIDKRYFGKVWTAIYDDLVKRNFVPPAKPKVGMVIGEVEMEDDPDDPNGSTIDSSVPFPGIDPDDLPMDDPFSGIDDDDESGKTPKGGPGPIQPSGDIISVLRENIKKVLDSSVFTEEEKANIIGKMVYGVGVDIVGVSEPGLYESIIEIPPMGLEDDLTTSIGVNSSGNIIVKTEEEEAKEDEEAFRTLLETPNSEIRQGLVDKDLKPEDAPATVEEQINKVLEVLKAGKDVLVKIGKMKGKRGSGGKSDNVKVNKIKNGSGSIDDKEQSDEKDISGKIFRADGKYTGENEFDCTSEHTISREEGEKIANGAHKKSRVEKAKSTLGETKLPWEELDTHLAVVEKIFGRTETAKKLKKDMEGPEEGTDEILGKIKKDHTAFGDWATILRSYLRTRRGTPIADKINKHTLSAADAYNIAPSKKTRRLKDSGRRIIIYVDVSGSIIDTPAELEQICSEIANIAKAVNVEYIDIHAENTKIVKSWTGLKTSTVADPNWSLGGFEGIGGGNDYFPIYDDIVKYVNDGVFFDAAIIFTDADIVYCPSVYDWKDKHTKEEGMALWSIAKKMVCMAFVYTNEQFEGMKTVILPGSKVIPIRKDKFFERVNKEWPKEKEK